MNIFEVWLDSWTMTDLVVFGTASLLVILFVAVRAILAAREGSVSQIEDGFENET